MAPTELEDSMASGSNRIVGPVFLNIPVKVSDERVVLRASVDTEYTVADRAATSIDTVSELELDVASLAGSETLSEIAIDMAAEERPFLL